VAASSISPKCPTMPHLETGFSQFEIVAEAEERHKLFDHDGKLKLLGWINRGRMGDTMTPSRSVS
jgi:high affinity Mn2+ porin